MPESGHPRKLDAIGKAARGVDGRILLKPASPNDARQMLSALSADTHTVITAFALAAAGHVLERDAVSARVTFRALGAREIDDVKERDVLELRHGRAARTITERLEGPDGARVAIAFAGAVVSKPMAKKTTSRDGFCSAIFSASKGE